MAIFVLLTMLLSACRTQDNYLEKREFVLVDSTSFGIEDPVNPGTFIPYRDSIRIMATTNYSRFPVKTKYRIIGK